LADDEKTLIDDRMDEYHADPTGAITLEDWKMQQP